MKDSPAVTLVSGSGRKPNGRQRVLCSRQHKPTTVTGLTHPHAALALPAPLGHARLDLREDLRLLLLDPLQLLRLAHPEPARATSSLGIFGTTQRSSRALVLRIAYL